MPYIRQRDYDRMTRRHRPPSFVDMCLAKLPPLDVTWSAEIQDAWWRCFQTIAAMNRQPPSPCYCAAVGIA